MGWLDAFTGAASKKAAGATVAGLGEANQMAGWGGDNARSQYGNAISFLQDQYGEAAQKYQPMTAYGQTGVDAYQAAMGLGPQGVAGMTNFQNTPGYQFARDQGLDAVMRNASARGMLAGGNTSADLMKYGTGIADQTYGSYLTRLNPLMEMYGQGIQGQGNALTGMGNQVANQYGNIGQSYMDEARTRAGLQSQIGQANAGGIMGAANAQAGTIQSGLNLVGQIAGFGTGGGGTIGSDFLRRLQGGRMAEMTYPTS